MVRNNNLFLKYFQPRSEEEEAPDADFQLRHGDSLYDMFTKLEFVDGLEFPGEQRQPEKGGSRGKPIATTSRQKRPQAL